VAFQARHYTYPHVGKVGVALQERAQDHSKLMGENISLVGLADSLISNPEIFPRHSTLTDYLK
jgi:hypothetical protein